MPLRTLSVCHALTLGDQSMLQVSIILLHQVIKGWDQGIVGGEGIPPMLAGTSNTEPSNDYRLAFAELHSVRGYVSSGGKRTLKLPPALAYGEKGAGCRGWEPTSCVIPPNSTLLFDVEYVGRATG